MTSEVYCSAEANDLDVGITTQGSGNVTLRNQDLITITQFTMKMIPVKSAFCSLLVASASSSTSVWQNIRFPGITTDIEVKDKYSLKHVQQ